MQTLMIKASVALSQELRKYKISAAEKALADLILAGWRDRDAYQVLGFFNALVSEPENWNDMKKLISKPEMQAYMGKDPGEKTKKKKDQEITDDDLNDLLSKDRQLRDLAKKLKYEDLDPKTEMDVRKMIADLQNFKKEQTVDEEKRVLYYMPIKCKTCCLYLKEKKAKTPPVELDINDL